MSEEMVFCLFFALASTDRLLEGKKMKFFLSACRQFSTMIKQTTITLPAFPRGFHLIDDEVLRRIEPLPETGIFHLFIQHTSAGLAINENADPSVRVDFEQVFDRRLMPENEPYLTHVIEGADDMPAHVKSMLVGASVTIPVTNGKLNLGTWQGIYLCEFRNHGGRRRLVATVWS